MRAAFTSGVIGGITGAAVGDVSILGGGNNWFARGFWQGVSSELRGGNFKDGFLGSVAQSFIPMPTSIKNGGKIGKVMFSAMSGGVSSKLGGGKFANGASSAAYAELLRPKSITMNNSSRSPHDRGKVAFVGGAGDSIDSELMGKMFKNHKYPGDKFFTWDQSAELAQWIADNGGNVTVIGHSYGADTAASVVAAGYSVDRLITVDPVGWSRPEFSRVVENSAIWENYNAMGSDPNSSWPNTVAYLGGKWGGDVGKYAISPKQDGSYGHANICQRYCRP